MLHGTTHRLQTCPACGKPAAGDGDHCIFCGANLLAGVVGWRSVYHPYSYADAMLATSALQSHGFNARVSVGLSERWLTGNARGVVQVADGEHLHAQEVLRQLRGVRTDTEFREWHEIKHRRTLRRGLMIGTLAALATAAGVAAMLMQAPATEEAATESRR
ncbi:MAG: hypothetical protein KF754_09590 [Planctomycetes bacterium]|nr:hypothetical protein [Planctomycetota bacterium]